MVAFWESPFRRFLYLDADTVLWGNPLDGIEWDGAQIITNKPHEKNTNTILRAQYFDPTKVFNFCSRFSWQELPYFNGGVFLAERDIFDLEEYLFLLNVQRKNPGVFDPGEQGILNFMTFRMAEKGLICHRNLNLQAVVPVLPRDDLKHRFRLGSCGPLIADHDRTIIHWAGRKPSLVDRHVFSSPMNYFRRVFHIETGKYPRFALDMILNLEEALSYPRQYLYYFLSRDALQEFKRI
jgi:hypothetical protein